MTVYYTQLIFVRAGEEGRFQQFEARVLPLLSMYNGQLLYRVCPSAGDIIESSIGRPYEVHLLSFQTREDFEAYASDPERRTHLPLKDASVERVLLIEGSEI